jgi:hypothetical protein
MPAVAPSMASAGARAGVLPELGQLLPLEVGRLTIGDHRPIASGPFVSRGHLSRTLRQTEQVVSLATVLKIKSSRGYSQAAKGRRRT